MIDFTSKRLDLGEEHRADRASLRAITENFFTESVEGSVVEQVLNTFAACRKCAGLTEFTESTALNYPAEVGFARFKTLCVKCGRRDQFTSKITKNNIGGVTIQVTWADKSQSPKHLHLVENEH
jgi:hypothetical protein